MTDQFNRAKRRHILNKVSDAIDKWDNANAKITEARQRAEKAEAEIERLRELITECDGIECTKHDGLVRIAVKERREAEERAARYGRALEFYALQWSHAQSNVETPQSRRELFNQQSQLTGDTPMNNFNYDRENAPTEELIQARREHHRIATLGQNKIIRDYHTRILNGQERVTRLLPRRRSWRQAMTDLINSKTKRLCRLLSTAL